MLSLLLMSRIVIPHVTGDQKFNDWFCELLLVQADDRQLKAVFVLKDQR